MTEIYSGRFDMICNPVEGVDVSNTETLRKFKEFLQYTECKQYVVTFEDTEKDGITKTKSHYHFLIYVCKSKKHNTMRCKMTDMGWKGALASLSIAHAPPKRTLEKAFHYVLKHGYIVAEEGISNLDELVKKAEAYNKNVVLTPSFHDHWYNFIRPQCMALGYTERHDIVVYAIKYCAQYSQNDRGHELGLPKHAVMLDLLQKYENKIDPVNSYIRILNDYRSIAGVCKPDKVYYTEAVQKVKELPKEVKTVTVSDSESDTESECSFAEIFKKNKIKNKQKKDLEI